MKCPYCKHEMYEGYILGEKFSVKWIPKERHIFFRLFSINGIRFISSFGTWKRARTKSFLCHKCQKVVIDFKDTKSEV
jgi:hypothetical protein